HTMTCRRMPPRRLMARPPSLGPDITEHLAREPAQDPARASAKNSGGLRAALAASGVVGIWRHDIWADRLSLSAPLARLLGLRPAPGEPNGRARHRPAGPLRVPRPPRSDTLPRPPHGRDRLRTRPPSARGAGQAPALRPGPPPCEPDQRGRADASWAGRGGWL